MGNNFFKILKNNFKIPFFSTFKIFFHGQRRTLELVVIIIFIIIINLIIKVTVTHYDASKKAGQSELVATPTHTETIIGIIFYLCTPTVV